MSVTNTSRLIPGDSILYAPNTEKEQWFTVETKPKLMFDCWYEFTTNDHGKRRVIRCTELNWNTNIQQRYARGQ